MRVDLVLSSCCMSDDAKGGLIHLRLELRHNNLGQLDPEAAAASEFRLQADGSAHALDTLSHNGQADAGAGIDAAIMQPLEEAEDFLVMLRRDPDSIV